MVDGFAKERALTGLRTYSTADCAPSGAVSRNVSVRTSVIPIPIRQRGDRRTNGQTDKQLTDMSYVLATRIEEERERGGGRTVMDPLSATIERMAGYPIIFCSHEANMSGGTAY